MAARKKNTTKTRPSLRKAVNDMCKTCIYDPNAGGTWLQQVTACTAGEKGCPLFVVRPTSKSGGGDE
jgi:hypothetical protein